LEGERESKTRSGRKGEKKEKEGKVKSLACNSRARRCHALDFLHTNSKTSSSLLSLLLSFSSYSLVRLGPLRAARHGGPNQLDRVLGSGGVGGGIRRIITGLPLGDRRVAACDGQRGGHQRFQKPRVLLVERRAVRQAARQAGQGVDGERDLVRGRSSRARPEAAEVLEGGGAGLVEALDLDLDVLPEVFGFRFSIVSGFVFDVFFDRFG
jgi:hypothetical protein